MRLRLPFIELASPSFEEGTAESPRSWVQCGVVGSFFSKRYKKFEITEPMFDEMIKNLSAGTDPVDYDHFSTRPHSERLTPDAGKAAGWIHGLQKRSGGRELWALVEWTKNAAELIRNKEYRFISPTIVPNFPDSTEEGKSLGTKMVAMALTNLPFLRMAPISLSADDETDILQLAQVSVSEWQTRISEAFYNKFNSSFDMGAYIVDYFDNYVICRKDGKLWKIPVEVDKQLNVSFGEPAEVIVNYKELSSDQGDTTMSDPKPAALSPEVIQLQADMAAMGQKVQAQATELSTVIAENKDLKQRLAKKDAEQKVDGLIRSGKLLPKQKEWAESYALSDSDGFDKFAQTLDVQVQLNKEHGHGKEVKSRETDPESDAAVIAEFSKLVNDMVANEKISFSEAMKKAQEQKPELALSYLEAMRVDPDVQ